MAKKVGPQPSAKETAPKAGARAKATKPKEKPTSTENASGAKITIRMYRQGLGDCFLLTISHGGSTKPTRVMIDCGVFLNTPGEAERMNVVANSILKDTAGAIDLLIVTHEHWDHISGFSHANPLFKKEFKFGEVWLSWAENPNDADARSIKAELGKSKAQLKAAIGLARKRPGMAKGSEGNNPARDDLDSSEGLLGFLGLETVDPPQGLAAAATSKGDGDSGRMDLGTTMDWLRGMTRVKDFCSPGEIRTIPGASEIKAYILGPPRSASQLRRMDPTGNQGYKLKSDELRSSALSFFSAVECETNAGAAQGSTPTGPFDDRFRIELDEASTDPFFRRHYGFPNDPLADPVAVWRRIDADWLVGGISRLALQLDVAVNNTSLALAFELPDGRTLIFPGDAQIGNWQSWGSLAFKAADKEGGGTEVTTKDLLNRAVFYKVGHHGSHNATMKTGGLEEMNGGDLVAMIPTDENYAHTKRPPKTGWEMPANGVYEALRHFTGGKIIRADDASISDIDRRVEDKSILETHVWQEFRGRVRFDDGAFPAEAKAPAAGTARFVEYAIEF